MPEKKRVEVTIFKKQHSISTVDCKLIGSKPGDTHPLMNIIIRKYFETLGRKRIFDDFFDTANPLHLEDDRVARAIDIFPGFVSEISQRLINGSPKYCLSLDPVHKVVSRDSILSLIGGMKDQNQIRRALRGKRVTTVYNWKTYGVEDIAFDMSPKSTFKRSNRKTGEEETVSFETYYKETGQVVRDLKQPLLVSTGRQRERIYLLPEFCVHASVPAIAKMKLPQITSVKPTERVKRISAMVEILNKAVTDKAGATLAQYGMKLDNKLIAVQKTVIAPPALTFAPTNVKKVGPEWRREASDVKYSHVTAKKKVQTVIVYDGRDANFVADYWRDIKGQLAKMAAPIEFLKEIMFPFDEGKYTKSSGWEQILTDACAKLPAGLSPKDVLLVPFLASDKRKTTAEYDAYRSFATRRGFVGQAIDCYEQSIDRKLDNRNFASIITNIARQIVNKFGTQSWWMTMGSVAPKHANKQFLFVGIDVYHAAPILKEVGSNNVIWQKRSIAAYTAKLSIGGSTLTYCDTEVRDAGAEISGQRTKSEAPSQEAAEPGAAMVRQKGEASDAPLGNFVAAALAHWKQFVKPEQLVVIVYRDGVADSQLDQVDAAEVAQLKPVMPAGAHLIYSVVQKRVHNRFVMSDAGRYGNCAAGTVVEDLARVDTRYNFFMVPCLTNLSTNKPVHYTITYDSKPNTITPAEFHAITFAQHHTYQNWAGTVKVPDVCQYAHKLAYTLGDSGVKDPRLHPDLKETMFYL